MCTAKAITSTSEPMPTVSASGTAYLTSSRRMLAGHSGVASTR
jgi:hypothetical protein